MSQQRGCLGACRWGRVHVFSCLLAVSLMAWGQAAWVRVANANGADDESPAVGAAQQVSLYLLGDRQKYEAAKAAKLRCLATVGQADIDVPAPGGEAGAPRGERLSEAGPFVRLNGVGIEDFEGAFPGEYWFVGDDDPNSGDDHWGTVSCNSYEGSSSAWCAAVGGASECSAYDHNMDAYMYVEAEYWGHTSTGTNKLCFALWNRVEDCCDWFGVKVEGFVSQPCGGSAPPDCTIEFPVEHDTGATSPWERKEYSLPACFDPCHYLRVKFVFHSDGSTVDGQGAYVDTIEFSNLSSTEIYPISGGFAPPPIWYKDGDDDGYGDPNNSIQACDQPVGYVLDDTDCDDECSTCHPGGTEVCDEKDNDCDGQIDDNAADALTWYLDGDGDGYGNPNSSVRACSWPSGYVPNALDCDDGRASVHPMAPEYCNGRDDDCDGQVDENPIDPSTWYQDTDGDGYGDSNSTTLACDQPPGYVSNDEDCDDSRSSVHPGAPEYCNGRDDDCDSQTDENAVDASTWYRDADGDGYGCPISTTWACNQPQGYVSNDDDCDDTRPGVHPGASEVCDGRDNNCDGQVDEGEVCGEPVDWCRDRDGDGFGDPTETATAAQQPSGFVSECTDCDDLNALVYPGAFELEDGLDNDCDGRVDEGEEPEGQATPDDDGDGVPNDQDACPNTPAGAAVDASGCPSGCCGAAGPVAPLGLAIGMLLLGRLGGYKRRRRRTR